MESIRVFCPLLSHMKRRLHMDFKQGNTTFKQALLVSYVSVEMSGEGTLSGDKSC